MEAFRCPAPALYTPKTNFCRPLKFRVSKITRFVIPNMVDERIRLISVIAEASASAYSSRENPMKPELHSRFPIRREEEEFEISMIKEKLLEASEQALEWRSVCSQVSAFASTAAGREVCLSGRIPVGRDRKESQKFLDQTSAAFLLLEKLDFSDVDDVSELVTRAVDGELLNSRELCAIRRSLTSAKRVLEQLLRIKSMEFPSDRYFPLVDILEKCDFMTELVNKIAFCIDCNLSVILDQASAKLTSIRLEKRQNMAKLEELLKDESIKVFQAGGIESRLITKRRTRMCIGVKASHKYLLPKGILLSVSGSGATYFMEPKGAVHLNNSEVVLTNLEKVEEIAILHILSSGVSKEESNIRHLMEKVIELDLACARGAYAQVIEGVCPIFVDNNSEKLDGKNPLVDIEGIRHPLLLQHFLTCLTSEAPVPVDIQIEDSKKVIVISGPNTGGKTATLKTLGLASIMSKAGLFLPAKKIPRIPWFDQIFTDIGDHQSLEHSLSTFSGHISHLCKIMQVITNESLVLIDEIGNGTDPSEGIALSSSILQHLADRVNLVMVTTHYTDLNLLKATDLRFENASMEFCMTTLQPTYHILWGITGTSNALNIAKSIGFDQNILDSAHKWAMRLAPDKRSEYQGLLFQSLIEDRNVLVHQAKEAASLFLDVKKLYFEIHAEASDLSTREIVLLTNESKSLQHDLRSAWSHMETVIKNFEDQLQTADTAQFNLILKKSESKIASIAEACQPTVNITSVQDKHCSYAPEIGERVYVKKFGDKVGVVVEALIENEIVIVQCGTMKIHVKKNDVRPVGQASTKDIATYSGFDLK